MPTAPPPQPHPAPPGSAPLPSWCPPMRDLVEDLLDTWMGRAADHLASIRQARSPFDAVDSPDAADVARSFFPPSELSE